jgi:restriction endonuclease S subunit
LKDDLGDTAATIEPNYILREDDLLIARSGNTVGKSYLHKMAHTPTLCFFAGYLIRFRFRGKELLPEYVFAFTQLPYYKEWVRAIQRAAGQPNINAQEYSNLEIPAAPTSIQRKVVSLLAEAYAVKRKHDSEAKELVSNIDNVLLEELGVLREPESPDTIESRIFESGFETVTGQRWDPNYARKMALYLSKINRSKTPIRKLKDLVSAVQYGISERATEEQVGVPMLRMLNLQDGEWALEDMKYIEMSEKEKKPYLLHKGDVLFNRTNSKELVGKCNVFDLEGEYVFASYLMRVSLKKGVELLPYFVVAYMASSIGRIQIDAVSRQIAGMTNINAEEVRELLIPVPHIKVQERVCQRVADIRAKARTLRERALADLDKAKHDIEALILDKEAGK